MTNFFYYRPHALMRNWWLALLLLIYCTLVVWTLLAGKDVNFDMLNYHIYGVKLMLDGRWEQDYFAASIQSYLNPISYVPFYSMIRMGWPSPLVAAILASWHFLAIIAIMVLAKIAFGNLENQKRQIISIVVCAAAATPIYLIVIGASFNDGTTAPLILFGLVAYLSGARCDFKTPYILAAGFLMGLATGIKLTNAVYPVALFLVCIAQCCTTRSNSALKALRCGFSFSVAALLGWGAMHGYWSWKLWETFGNPVFPFYNSIFGAPEFPSVDLQDRRYLGDGFYGLLILPWLMLRSEAWIYSETVAPTVFPAITTILVVLVVVVYVLRQLKGEKFPVWTEEVAATRGKNSYAIIAFVGISFLLWGALFRIGRYALPIWLLLPLCIAILSHTIFSTRVVKFVLFFSLAAQIFVSFMSEVQRWDSASWQGKWLPFEIPSEIQAESAVFLTVETQSLAAIAGFINSKSSLANITGQHTFPSGNAMSPRLREIIEDSNRPVYLVRNFLTDDRRSASSDIVSGDWTTLNSMLLPYGLAISTEKRCVEGRLNFSVDASERVKNNGFDLFFCPLRKASEKEVEAGIADQTRYDRLFDLLEEKCPERFSPGGASTIKANGNYMRSYFNSGTHIFSARGALYAGAYRQWKITKLLALDQAENDPSPAFECPPAVNERFLR